jgi:hypothetical protein
MTTAKINKSLPALAMLQAFLRMARTAGVRAACAKALRYARNLRKTAKILEASSIEDRFTTIYADNYWGDKESVSGYGSTLRYTTQLRDKLPALFERFHINSIFDAPCGDFNWMPSVLVGRDLHYVGADIVKPLIEALNAKHQTARVSFEHLDLTADAFPAADLWICRDCLFHLSRADTERALKRFIESNIPYLLTTTHKNLGEYQNVDIKTGDFRFIDLFAAPYNFPADVLFRIDDYHAPEQPREMCLWSRAQILNSLSQGA